MSNTDRLPLAAATKIWFLISLQTFGGPAGQIAVMQRILVDEQRWVSQQRFLFALSYCTLLPGPEAQQLATYIGWLLNGMRGALIAGWLFVLPGLVALLGLSAVYVAFGDTSAVEAVFLGLSPAVIAVVLQAVFRVAKRSLTSTPLRAIALAAFAALTLFAVPFPIVIAAAAAAGWWLARRRTSLGVSPTAVSRDVPPTLIPDEALHVARPSWSRSLAIAGVGLPLWAAPVLVAALLSGRHGIFTTQGLFFSVTALITFGGAYAVLSFVAHQAVVVYGWLSARDMVKGLALAETTPGPLIMVLVFVAFVGAYRSPAGLNPWVAAMLAGLLTTWVTFVPCFLFILLGAPYVERLRHNENLAGALTGISAAVVGIIGNLACFFAVHTLFARTHHMSSGPLDFEFPAVASVRFAEVAIALLGTLLIFRRSWSVLSTMGACAIAGVAYYIVAAYF